jgi:hypothetical protein
MKRRFYSGVPPEQRRTQLGGFLPVVCVKTRQGTPTQLTCRGALYGYPGSRLSNSLFELGQDVKILKLL